MLDVIEVSKRFEGRKQGTDALMDVSLSVERGEIFALIGESGSGKSTLAELIVGLQQPTRGVVRWREEAAAERAPDSQAAGRCSERSACLYAGRAASANARSRVQIVFQNPDRSMNPYWSVQRIVTEPLLLNGVNRTEAAARASELLEQVRLPQALLERKPAECSGGQKQRVAIARALALSPRLLIADEITSALDPGTEREILQLLLALRDERRMSILYITHRLETIGGFADRLAVMKDGRVVETGETEEVLEAPKSAYTKQLLAACLYP